MAEMVNGTQLAKLLGVSKTAVSKAVAAGRLTPELRDKTGPKFDPVKAVVEWNDRADYNKHQSRHTEEKSKGGRPKKTEADTVPITSDLEIDLKNLSDAKKHMKAKAAQAIVDFQMAKLKLQEKKREVIPVEEVRQGGIDLGTILMGALAAFPDRVSQQISAMTDAHAIHDLLSVEINVMITAIRTHCGLAENEQIETSGAG